MHALITCKYKKDQIKNNQEKVETSFSHYKSMRAFCCHGNQETVLSHYKSMGNFLDAQGQLTP